MLLFFLSCSPSGYKSFALAETFLLRLLLIAMPYIIGQLPSPLLQISNNSYNEFVDALVYSSSLVSKIIAKFIIRITYDACSESERCKVQFR